MPRSSLLNALMRIAADVDSARRPARPVGCGPKIGRRAALRGAAPLAGMALLPAGSRCSGGSSGHRRRGSGGAYRCVRTVQGGNSSRSSTRAARGSEVAASRSSSTFPGQIAEHGGEFINTGQKAIRDLASALGLQLDDTYMTPTMNYDELWSFDDVATPTSRRQRITRRSTR